MITSILKIVGYSPFKTLMLREYWENRRAILTTPLIITILSMVIVIISMGILGNAININGNIFTLSELVANMSTQDAQGLKDYIHHLLLMSATPIMIGAWFSMMFTALSSLYDEKKDNSILFWKSMPLSDFKTILSKLLTATLVIPLVALGFVTIFQVFLLVIGSFATIGTDYSAWTLLWAPANFPTLILAEVSYIVVYGLWALPIIAWLMFVSVFSKRSPFILAIVPIILIILFEIIFFQSRFLAQFMSEHLSGGPRMANFNPLYSHTLIGYVSMPSFWIGLSLAALLLYITILQRKRNSL